MDFEKLARMSNGISQLREALGIGHTESVSEAQLRTLVDERIAAQSGSTNVAVGDTTVDQSNNRGGDAYNLGAGSAGSDNRRSNVFTSRFLIKRGANRGPSRVYYGTTRSKKGNV